MCPNNVRVAALDKRSPQCGPCGHKCVVMAPLANRQSDRLEHRTSQIRGQRLNHPKVPFIAVVVDIGFNDDRGHRMWGDEFFAPGSPHFSRHPIPFRLVLAVHP